MYNNNASEDEAREQGGLTSLVTEADKIAVWTLLDDTISSPSVARHGALDSVFKAIANPGRRYVLTYLLCAEGYVTMTELVDYVMSKTDRSKPDEKLREEITVSLTHTHLPKLAEEEFITYNMERQLIMQTEKTPLVAPYLKVALIQQQRLSELVEQ